MLNVTYQTTAQEPMNGVLKSINMMGQVVITEMMPTATKENASLMKVSVISSGESIMFRTGENLATIKTKVV